MSSIRKKSGQFVVPGEKLGVIEEFTPGPGTYVKGGNIYAKVTGHTLIDLLNKRVSVYPAVPTVNVPRVGSIVVGQVHDMQRRLATIRIFNIGKRPLSGVFTGILHISDATRGYVDYMHYVCRTGDVIRAKVTSNKNRTYHLTTAEKNLGVIYAFCSNCGDLLRLRRKTLLCLRCGKTEKRKIAFDYSGGMD